MRIDAHNHFWKYNPVKHSWINNEMEVLKRDFMPSHLETLLQEQDIVGCVAVQAQENTAETGALLELAKTHSIIKGVIGWLNFLKSDIQAQLEYYTTFEKLKGFRYVLQDKEDRKLMLNPVFVKNIKILNQYNFTYDILIFPDQLQYAAQLIKKCPKQRFVIDHLAKPYIKDNNILQWKKDIITLAKFENVSCKISGLLTEADWKHWTPQDITPYLDVAVEAFGTKRLMYGSDWPVCLIAASYSEVFGLVNNYFSSSTKEEQDAVFGKNAIDFYNLEI